MSIQVYEADGVQNSSPDEKYKPSLAEQVACVKIDALPYIDVEVRSG